MSLHGTDPCSPQGVFCFRVYRLWDPPQRKLMLYGILKFPDSYNITTEK